MSFSLSYAEVIRVLSKAHSVPEESAVAFRGRLQHFQRLGFPAGINTGRGRPAQYGFGQLLMLALGIELIQVGLTPEKAIAVLNANEIAVYQAVASTLDLKAEWFRKDIEFWIGFAPASMTAALTKSAPWFSEEEATFFYGGTGIVIHTLQSMKLMRQTRITLIQLSDLLRNLSGIIIGYTTISGPDLYPAIKEWLDAEILKCRDIEYYEDPDEVGTPEDGAIPITEIGDDNVDS